jgi:ABC-type polysaccharide/polyol phosphate transport system ATPase subunit
MWYGFRDILRDSVGVGPNSDGLRRKEFWAVDDVSFELKKGETLGLIGPNGAGKSTILKMLNGIILPDRGSIRMKGRVGALIEIGAGFHPMLTGRENIYINGAILGMGKREIDKKFDAIVEFADIGDFLDTPVKHYSSGMFVRLGFAIAVHCEPDILLVDEVLAVGDLAFAYKCHTKMSEFRLNGGTVIMVTHNMQAIRNMCERVLWLNGGGIKEIGEVHDVCDLYETYTITHGRRNQADVGIRLHYDETVNISKVEFVCENGERSIKLGAPLKIRIHYKTSRIVKKPIFIVSIYSVTQVLISSHYSHFDGYGIERLSGEGYVEYIVESPILGTGRYICSITISEGEVSNSLDRHEKMHGFAVVGERRSYGLVNQKVEWRFDEKDKNHGA